MKKSIAFRLLCALLCAALPLPLFSCAVLQPGRRSAVKLTVWHHFIGDQKTAFDALVAEFNSTAGRRQGVAVAAVSVDNSGDISSELLRAAKKELGSPALPDIATAYPQTALTLYQKGLLAQLNPYFTKAELAAYVPGFLSEGVLTPQSGLVVFPIAKSTEVLYVDGAAYRRFLADYNRKNPGGRLGEGMLSTFEGIEKTAECYCAWTDAQTPNRAGDGKTLFGFDSVSNFAIAGTRQLGGELLSGAHGLTLAGPQFEAVWRGYVTPTAKGVFGAYSLYRSQDVQTGDLVMYTGSTAGATFFPQTVTFPDNTKRQTELKVLPYPVFQGGERAAVQQGAGMIVFRSAEARQRAACTFLKWFTEPERNTAFVLKTGYLPVTEAALKTNLPAALKKSEGDASLSDTCRVLETALSMMGRYRLYTYEPFDNSDVLRAGFEDALTRQAQESRKRYLSARAAGRSPEEALAEAAGAGARAKFRQEMEHEAAAKS